MSVRKYRMYKPRVFRSPEHFSALANAYFIACEAEGLIPVSSGLMRHMGFTDRASWHAFAKIKPEYSNVLRDSMSFVEQLHEYGVSNGEDSQGGKRFLLKTVFKHSEKIEVDVKPVQVSIEGHDAKL